MRAVLALAALTFTGCLEAQAGTGDKLMAIVIASRDLPAGTMLSFDDISQRSVAEKFVTSSIVKPDAASYIVNQRSLMPILAGDPMLWAFFETAADSASHDACAHALVLGSDAKSQVAQSRALVLSK